MVTWEGNMKRIILCVAVLLLIGSCKDGTDEVITKADDAIYLLTSTNWETRIWNEGDGHARVSGEIVVVGRCFEPTQRVQFSPKDIQILLDQKNEHYEALGDILYMYANPDTYERMKFAEMWSTFRGSVE